MGSLILCDVNVWLAFVLTTHGHHRAVKSWFDKLGDGESLLFCRSTQQGFLRLLTTEGLLRKYGHPPLNNTDAVNLYRKIMADDRVTFEAAEPPGTEALWFQLAARNTASPKLWMDAYLAAFAMAGGHSLATFDQAFRQFDGLDLRLLQD